MLKNLNMVEDVEIALKGMVKFRQRILRRLKSTEKEAVWEAFSELGRYAATIQHEQDLIAFSETLYHIINEAPTLRGFLPKKEADALKTKDVPLSVDDKAHDEKPEQQHTNARAAEMGNEICVIIGNKTSQPFTASSPQDSVGREIFLLRIFNNFNAQIDQKSSS